MDKDIEEFDKFMDGFAKLFAFILALGVLFLFILASMAGKQKAESPKLNGICKECNIGHYQFIQAVGHRGPTTYIVKCDNCGDTRETRYIE
jgi:hypothetical protein